MIHLFHGDQVVASRRAYMSAIESVRSKGIDVTRFAAKSLDPLVLEKNLQPQSLFGIQQAIAIENLGSLPKGAKKTRLLEMVAKAEEDVFLWEEKLVGVTDQKILSSGAQKLSVQLFKTSPVVFKWLDTISPKTIAQSMTLFHQAVAQDSTEFCFAMLCRQIRLLIQVKDGGVPKVAPFALTKLKKQATQFSLEQLLSLHERLVEIEEEQKTSASPLKLDQKLDLLMATI